MSSNRRMQLCNLHSRHAQSITLTLVALLRQPLPQTPQTADVLPVRAVLPVWGLLLTESHGTLGTRVHVVSGVRLFSF